MLFFDQLDGGPSRHAGHRIAAESGDVRTLESASNLRRGHRQANGHAVGHTFRSGDHVRNHFPLLDTEPSLTSASPAGLYFVGDKQRAVLFHDLEDNLEVFFGRSDETTDALNRFGDKGSDISAGPGLNEILHVIRAGHFAIGILQVQRTAIAIGIHSMRNADTDNATLAIW